MPTNGKKPVKPKYQAKPQESEKSSELSEEEVMDVKRGKMKEAKKKLNFHKAMRYN